MIRRLLLSLLCLDLGGCMAAAAPATDLVLNAMGRAVANQVSGATQQSTAAPVQPAAAQSVTVLDFDVPADALKAKDAELSQLLRKAGEVALKYDVPVMLVSNSGDRDYLMHELNQAGEPVIMYRLGEYPRISINLKNNGPTRPREGR